MTTPVSDLPASPLSPLSPVFSAHFDCVTSTIQAFAALIENPPEATMVELLALENHAGEVERLLRHYRDGLLLRARFFIGPRPLDHQ